MCRTNEVSVAACKTVFTFVKTRNFVFGAYSYADSMFKKQEQAADNSARPAGSRKNAEQLNSQTAEAVGIDNAGFGGENSREYRASRCCSISSVPIWGKRVRSSLRNR